MLMVAPVAAVGWEVSPFLLEKVWVSGEGPCDVFQFPFVTPGPKKPQMSAFCTNQRGF